VLAHSQFPMEQYEIFNAIDSRCTTKPKQWQLCGGPGKTLNWKAFPLQPGLRHDAPPRGNQKALTYTTYYLTHLLRQLEQREIGLANRVEYNLFVFGFFPHRIHQRNVLQTVGREKFIHSPRVQTEGGGGMDAGGSS